MRFIIPEDAHIQYGSLELDVRAGVQEALTDDEEAALLALGYELEADEDDDQVDGPEDDGA